MSSVCVSSLACAASFVIFFNWQRVAQPHSSIPIARCGHNSVSIVILALYAKACNHTSFDFYWLIMVRRVTLYWFCSPRITFGVWLLRLDF